MKKIITLAAMAAAVLAGCTKQEVPAAVETDTQEAQYITMNAGFVNADTKLAFEADGTGYKATWTTSDIVRLYYNNNQAKPAKGAKFTAAGDVTPGTDATTAQIKFNVTGIPDSVAVKWGAYVSNGHETATESYGFWTDSYGTQDGTEASAQKLIFFYAGGDDLFSDLNSPVSFSCNNTMLKFTLTFPNGVTGTASDITISGDNIYTTANYSWGGLYSGNKGNITISDQTITDGKITFWATVAPPKDAVSNVVVSAKVGETTYRASVGNKELAAGKVYNIARTLADNIVATYWANDATGSTAFTGTAADDAKTSKHNVMTYTNSTGKITWTANETGKPRTDTLEFTNGDQFILTQVEEKDIAGDYTFITKVFKGTGGIWPKADPTKIDVTFACESGVEELTDVDGITKHTNDIKITGIYDAMVLPASFEIDYNAKTAKLGIFMDARDGKGQKIGEKYLIFTPALCTINPTSTWGAKYVFNETELGTPDYTWWWFDFDVEKCTFICVNRTSKDIPMQELTQYTTDKTTAKHICGIDVVSSDSNVFDHTTVVPDYSTNGGYLNVFQINPAGYKGISFVKK